MCSLFNSSPAILKNILYISNNLHRLPQTLVCRTLGRVSCQFYLSSPPFERLHNLLLLRAEDILLQPPERFLHPCSRQSEVETDGIGLAERRTVLPDHADRDSGAQ